MPNSAGSGGAGLVYLSAKTRIRVPIWGRQATNTGDLNSGQYPDLLVVDSNGNHINPGAVTPVGLSYIGVAKALYSFGTDGGAISTITPSLNATIPANAILIGGHAKAGTAIAATAGATIAIGTSAGSSTTALLSAASGALANWAADAIIPLVPTFAAPVELTAAGKITLTIAVHALTAGTIEVFVYFIVPAHA